MEEYYAGYAHCNECRKLDDLFIVRIPTGRKRQSGQSIRRKKYLCAACKTRYENLEVVSSDLGCVAGIFKHMSPSDIDAELDVIAPIQVVNQIMSSSKRRKQKKMKNVEVRSKSGFHGVTKHRQGWMAYIRHQGKQRILGYYETPEEAARVYDRVAIRLKGDDAITNFPRDQYGNDLDVERKRKLVLTTNTTGFRGVAHYKRGQFSASIYYQGKQRWIGAYTTPEEAAHAYDREAIRLKGDKAITNFPYETYEQIPDGEQRKRKQIKKLWDTNTSGFRGVRLFKNGRYVAYAYINGKQHTFGYYDTAEEAARVRDRAVIHFFGDQAVTNFPIDEYDMHDDNSLDVIKRDAKKRLWNTNTSGFRGVRLTDSGMWNAAIFVENRQRYIGNYDTPEEAAHAYDREAIRLKGDKAITNFPRETYD